MPRPTKLGLFCVRYDDMTTMATKGRPAGGDNISENEVEWRDQWHREGSARNGDFIAYRLDDGKDAIWWEDSVSPVACFVHGPEGSSSALVSAFLGHGFKLEGS
jgi:hypothetical protein